MMSALRGKGECIHLIMAVMGCVSIKVTLSGVQANILRTLFMDGPLPSLSHVRYGRVREGAAALQRRVRVSPFAIQMELLTLPAPRAVCSALCKIIVQNREKRMNDRRLKQLGNWNELLFFRQTG